MAGGNRNPQDVSISCGFCFFLASYFYESNGSSAKVGGLGINICSPKKEKFDISNTSKLRSKSFYFFLFHDC
jgi:hypothetical protein